MSQNNWANVLKDRIDLGQHISKYCDMTDKGERLQGDHGTKHTSEGGECLSVFDNGDGWAWYCYNCLEGGDVIDFEMDYNGTNFVDACRQLADEYSVDLPYGSQNGVDPAKYAQQKKDRATLKDVMAFIHDAALWFHEQALQNDQALSYYKDRGMTESTIRQLKLGWAPKGNGLYKAFKDKYDLDTMVKSGLVRKSNRGSGTYTFFQERYIFPYFNGNPAAMRKDGTTRAKIVFMIGRDIDDKSDSKYIKMAAHSEKNPQIMKDAFQHMLWGASEFDKDKPTVIVEGIVDAILARQSIGGSYNIISPITSKMNGNDIESFMQLLGQKKPKHETVICYDTEENKVGQKGSLKTAKDMIKKYDKLFPEPEDEDEKKNHYRPTIKIATLRKAPEVNKVDVADYIQNDRRAELLYWIDAARTIWEYEAYLNNDPRRFFEFSKNQSSKVFMSKTMRDELLSEGRFFISIGEIPYIYKDGVYTQDFDGILKKTIMNKLRKKTSPSLVNNAVSDLVDYTTKNPRILEDLGDYNILNIKNGLLNINAYLESGDVNDIEIMRHDPYRISMTQLPIDFDPEADCPKINTFLEEVLPSPDDVTEFWKSIGYTLLPVNKYHKAFLFYGKGGNGKGVALELIKTLIGEENCANRPLKDFTENNFAKADLYGKLANICGEVENNYLPDTSTFKSLTGGDTISAERKHKPAFSYKPFAKLFFSANKLPKTRDKTKGMERRWQFFGFDQEFPEGAPKTDPDLFEKLSTESEMAGMLLKGLSGLLELVKAKGFRRTERSAQIMDEWKEEDNPVLTFINELVKEQSDVCIAQSLLYKCYKRYHEENNPNMSIKSAQNLNKEIQEMYPHIQKKQTKCDYTQKKVNCWVGIDYDGNPVEALDEYEE